MCSILSSDKAIAHHKKIPIGLWECNPAKVLVLFLVGLQKFTKRPIAHHAEGAAPVDHCLDGLVPAQGGMILILIPQDFSVDSQRLLNFGPFPRKLSFD